MDYLCNVPLFVVVTMCLGTVQTKSRLSHDQMILHILKQFLHIENCPIQGKD